MSHADETFPPILLAGGPRHRKNWPYRDRTGVTNHLRAEFFSHGSLWESSRIWSQSQSQRKRRTVLFFPASDSPRRELLFICHRNVPELPLTISNFMSHWIHSLSNLIYRIFNPTLSITHTQNASILTAWICVIFSFAFIQCTVAYVIIFCFVLQQMCLRKNNIHM